MRGPNATLNSKDRPGCCGPVHYQLPIYAQTNHNNAIRVCILQTRSDRIRVLSVPFTRTLYGLPDCTAQCELVTLFDWLDQLRYTPSYTTMIALFAGGAVASLTTLAGVRRTVQHQREESERDREHEQLLKHAEARNAHRGRG